MNFSEAKSYIITLGPSKKEFTIDAILKALKCVGNPHEKLKTIIVGGTNGKGSTSTMLATMLSEAGYRVGLYNSPFVKEITETIRINGTPISKRMFSRLTAELKEKVRIPLSYFEFKTLLVFYYFWKSKVDVTVLEVGLGGKLDCTNVTNPLLAIITNVNLDHTEILGDTCSKIARDKIGIAKKGTFFITGEKRSNILKIFKAYCRKKEAYFISTKDFSNKSCVRNLSPVYQKENALLAINAAELLSKQRLFMISQKAIKEGIRKFSIIGRFQKIATNPTIIFDIAHNPHGIEALIRELEHMKYNKLIVVLGIMRDKDHKRMVYSIQKIADTIIFTISKIERSWKESDIKGYKRKSDFCIPHSKAAYRYARKIAEKNDLIVVTGSSYLVGELIPKSACTFL